MSETLPPSSEAHPPTGGWLRRNWVRGGLALAMLAMAAGVLGFLVYRERQVLIHYDWQFRPLPIVLSFVLFTLTVTFASLVWGWMMNDLGSPISYWTHVRLYFITYVSRRLPGSLWYVAGRAYLYRQEGVDSRLTSLASAVEYAVIMISGLISCLLFSFSLLLQYQVSPFLLIALLVVGLMVLHPRVLQWVFRLFKVDIRSLPFWDVLGWTAAYVGIWILGGLSLFAVAAIVYPLSLSYLGLVVGIWILTGLISSLFLFLPSNMGVTEVSISLMLARVMPPGIAVLVAIVTRICFTLYELAWAVIWLALPGIIKSIQASLTQKD